MTAYHSPDDVAGVLHIKPPTLRKYSLLLERSGYTFHRNSQQHRWYTDTDIIALQKLITFKDSGGMKLEDSVQAVVLWSKSDDVTPRDTLPETLHTDSERNEDIDQAKLYNFIQQQQKAIERMADTLQQQAEQNRSIMEKLDVMQTVMQTVMEQSEAEKETAAALPLPEVEKKGLWSRIFRG